MNERAVYMTDLTDLATVMANSSGRDAEQATEAVIHMMGDDIASLASAYAPRRTGELAQSIIAIHGPMSTEVKATAPHAAYVEFGTWSHNVLAPKTGTYEIRPVRGRTLRFTAADGRVVHTKVVRHPGIRPQPYLGPAHDAVIEEYMGRLGNVATMLVVGP